jgi:hypothetical protein
MNTNSSGNPSISSATLVAGTTYFITVSTYPSPQSTPFNINIQTVACGGSTGNDYCQNAQPIAPGGSNLNGSTVGYTADIPSNLNSVFCGSIENNQWYSFVATATTATFNITAVGGGSACPYGIQAHVYSISGSGSCGTCANFASVSNCFNPGTMSTGTVNATGLTVGQTYYLMIDGNAGSGCTFTIANWANTTLPVRVVDFYGENKNTVNKLFWQTEFEEDIDYYIIERSIDGENYQFIARQEAMGNSHELKLYDVTDENAPEGVVYYRLRAIELNGSMAHSQITTIKRNSLLDITVHPNPANAQLFINSSASLTDCNITVVNTLGTEVHSDKRLNSDIEWVLDVSNLPAGVYVVIISGKSSSGQYRFIKQ